MNRSKLNGEGGPAPASGKPLAVPTSSGCYEIRFELRQDDIRAWYEINLLGIMGRDSRFVSRLLWPSIMYVLLTASLLSRSPSAAPWEELFMLYLLVPVYWAIMFWRYRRRIRRFADKLLAGATRLQLGLKFVPEGFVISWERGAEHRTWSDLEGLQISRSHLFFVMEGGVLVVPRRRFETPHEWVQFLQELATYSGQKLRCPNCKYILIGTTGGRCPECGYPDAGLP